MNCPLCGDVCRCSPEPESDARPHSTLPATDEQASSGLREPSPTAARDEDEPASLSEDAGARGDFSDKSGSPGAPSQAIEDGSAWREQLSARLSQYRSRRKARPPRYPSLRLPFEDPLRGEAGRDGSLRSPGRPYEAVSKQALAPAWTDSAAPPLQPVASALSPPVMSAALPARSLTPSSAHSSAKIIAFPHAVEMAPARPWDELAEPVTDRPRILDVPEVATPPPALGGIIMEGPQRDEIEKRPGIDIPLQNAPLARRLLAAAIDGFIIASASAVFGLIFWKMTAIRPPRFQLLGLAAGVPALFWVAYQYLLIVYAATTPGLRLVALEITRFDGSLSNRRLRRWRVLASYLSAVSLGMGFAWVFLDEDSLCWHDRITHTYLARKKRAAATGESQG